MSGADAPQDGGGSFVPSPEAWRVEPEIPTTNALVASTDPMPPSDTMKTMDHLKLVDEYGKLWTRYNKLREELAASRSATGAGFPSMHSSDYSRLKKDYDKLQKAFVKLQKCYDDTNEHFARVHEECESIQATFEIVRNQNDEMQQRIGKLESNYTYVSASNTAFETKNSKLSSEVTKMQGTIVNLKEANSTLEDEVVELKGENATLKTNILDLNQRNLRVTGRLNALEEKTNAKDAKERVADAIDLWFQYKCLGAKRFNARKEWNKLCDEYDDACSYRFGPHRSSEDGKREFEAFYERVRREFGFPKDVKISTLIGIKRSRNKSCHSGWATVEQQQMLIESIAHTEDLDPTSAKFFECVKNELLQMKNDGQLESFA